MSEWWDFAPQGAVVEQGHLFETVHSPRLDPNTMKRLDPARPKLTVGLEVASAITATQSCDFRNERIKRVLLFKVFPVEFVRAPPYNFDDAKLQEIRDNRRPSWIMLSGLEDARDKDKVMLVDFRQLIMLPFEYIKHLAATDGGRPALRSPYLEHFSSAVGRYYARVALEQECPTFVDVEDAVD